MYKYQGGLARNGLILHSYNSDFYRPRDTFYSIITCKTCHNKQYKYEYSTSRDIIVIKGALHYPHWPGEHCYKQEKNV